MTLRELEWQGLLVLPEKNDWKNSDGTLPRDSGDLILQHIQMWGYNEGNDMGIRLFCQDALGETYEAEIAQLSDCLSRGFMSYFFAENYEQKLFDIFNKEMELSGRDTKYMSIFGMEFTRPGLGDMRCVYFAKQEAEAEARAKNKLRIPGLAKLRKANRQNSSL